MHGVENDRQLIDETDAQIGQLVYYIFFDHAHLFIEESEIKIPRAKTNLPSISLIDFITASRLDAELTALSHDTAAFRMRIDALTNTTKKHGTKRKLTHAIYHQAHPEKCLFLREFIQNAIDAYGNQVKNAATDIAIIVTKNATEECVLSMRDTGAGMSLEQIFKYLLTPGSSNKRHATRGKFIGGRGVGLFTAFHGARKLIIKTSAGKDNTHYVELTPQYETLANGERLVADILVDWCTVNESFQGTLIQRISMETDPELEAAKYNRALSTHAKFINKSEFVVRLNGQEINQALQPLIEFNMPSVGIVKIYKSIENAITAGGLYVKPFDNDFIANLPTFIKKVFEHHSLVVELPKSVALNRERNDFEDTDQFTHSLKANITQGLIGGYLALFTKSHAKLDELPYDFFCEFMRRSQDLIARNPEVQRDAMIINSGKALDDYTLYKDSQRLTDLMCCLHLIPYKVSDYATPSMLSIFELAILYRKGELITEFLPNQIKDQIMFDKIVAKNKVFYKMKTDEIAIYRNYSWILMEDTNVVNATLFYRLCDMICKLTSETPIEIRFSISEPGALAYTSRQTNILYWNVINVFNDDQFKSLLLGDNNKALSFYTFRNVLEHLFDVISHELVHMGESECTGTHNQAFSIKQRRILGRGLANTDFHAIYDFYVAFFDKEMKGKTLPDAIEFIKLQLSDYINELQRQVAKKAVSTTGLFAPNAEKAHSADKHQYAAETKRVKPNK